MQTSLYNVPSWNEAEDDYDVALTWVPEDYQWWCCSFNYDNLGPNTNNLLLIAKIDFSEFSSLQEYGGYSLETMYQDFVDGLYDVQRHGYEDGEERYEESLEHMEFIFDDEALSVYIVFSDHIG